MQQNTGEKKSKNKEKRTRVIKIRITGGVILAIVIVCVILKILNADPSSVFLKNTKDAIIGEEGTVTTISKASLEKVFEISELSTVDYSYNAVARAYEEDGATPKYYVAYEGTVTAGIDFSKIVIDIDEDTKIITITLPESEIQNTTVDFGSMDYIFENKKYETETVSQEAYELCKTDLARRAAKENDLMTLAKENAVTAVEALVDPWVQQIDGEYKVNIKPELFTEQYLN